ncbi:hypothetical protein DY000_02034812 [Brassica cretica]|uniref:TF-B3 domain-containing protein n=1 Tax=Brassica cretica TaxID=69181 RepID=A0ABQ7DFP3_BRACR|nr:hypothetical protein DY000_02034812 [Brassica cretica]
MLASNTPTHAASRPTTIHASNTLAYVARRPSTMHALNTSAPAARRPSTTLVSNTSAYDALRVLARNNPTPKPTTMLVSNTTSPAASKLAILPGFIKVIDTNDLISHECTINVASLGVGVVLPKERVSLQIRDIHKRIWPFQHNHNHILESHTLTNGWQAFVNIKKLSAGDSLVFVMTEDGLMVEIRRAPRSIPALFNISLLLSPSMGERLSMIGSGVLYVEELSKILGKPFSNSASSDHTLKFDYFSNVHSRGLMCQKKD